MAGELTDAAADERRASEEVEAVRVRGDGLVACGVHLTNDAREEGERLADTVSGIMVRKSRRHGVSDVSIEWLRVPS